ncbi:MAG: hypothetical protein GF364_14030, partial [Candidatus Lokiarchaeota archaeon]|nr:hypothetical protein [Candidatus Lokiarchaeota archaeon]
MNQESQRDSTESPELNEETLRVIDRQILHRNYNEVIDSCISIILENLYAESKEYYYELLEKLTIICDKSPEIAQKIINKVIVPLINHNDDWIKTEALMILEKISKYKPDELYPIIEYIQNALDHPDNNIREISLNIIGNILLNQQDLQEDLISFLIGKLNDKLWRIRVRALKIMKKLAISEKVNEEVLNQFIELMAKKVGDPDEEVQSLAVESISEIIPNVSSKVFLYILFKLISHQDWQIQEKGIWLVGEVGKSDYSLTITQILPKLINLLDDSNFAIQTKIIDACVKIGRVYPKKIVNLLLKNLETNTEKYSGLFDIFMYLGIERPKVILPYIFYNLNVADKDPTLYKFVKESLLKLEEEIPDIIEQFVASEFSNFESIDWRVRKNTVEIMGLANLILKKESIAVWTDIRLKELLEVENDPEVIRSIKLSIDQVNNAVDNIDLIVKEIDQETNLFYQQMMGLQNLPASLKTKLMRILNNNEFREASITLEEEINKAIKKIENFGDNIYTYRFKRLAVDLIEDWTYSRLELLEELSDLKAFISEEIEKSKKKYAIKLEEKVSKIKDRIDVLKSELDFIADLNTTIKELIMDGQEDKAKKKLEHLAYVRDKIYRLESEIGTIWIENLDFKEYLKDITVYWVKVKIEAQQLLYTISYNLRDLHEYIDKSGDDEHSIKKQELKKELSFELLLNEFQNLVLHSTKSIQEQFERFSLITSPVKDEIKQKKFENAINLLDLIISQTNSSIEDFNKEIMKLYKQLDDIAVDVERSNLIRQYLDDWNEIKDSLLERSHEFYRQTSQDILLNIILSLQEIVNPIPLNSIAKKFDMREQEILERLFKLIEKGLLTGKIRNNRLYLPENEPKFDKSLYLSKKVEVIGAKMYFMVRLENKSKSFLHDMTLLLSWPEFLNLN